MIKVPPSPGSAQGRLPRLTALGSALPGAAQPLPRVLERAASRAAHSTASDHSGGVTIHVVPKTAPTGSTASSNIFQGVEDRPINFQLWGAPG